MIEFHVWDAMAEAMIEDLLQIVEKTGGGIKEVEAILKQKTMSELHQLLVENHMLSQDYFVEGMPLTSASVIQTARRLAMAGGLKKPTGE